MFIFLTHARCADQIFINEKENLVFSRNLFLYSFAQRALILK